MSFRSEQATVFSIPAGSGFAAKKIIKIILDCQSVSVVAASVLTLLEEDTSI